MPLYEATAIAGLNLATVADDQEHATDLFFDMIKEDYPDADFYDLSGVKESK